MKRPSWSSAAPDGLLWKRWQSEHRDRTSWWIRPFSSLHSARCCLRVPIGWLHVDHHKDAFWIHVDDHAAWPGWTLPHSWSDKGRGSSWRVPTCSPSRWCIPWCKSLILCGCPETPTARTSSYRLRIFPKIVWHPCSILLGMRPTPGPQGTTW